MLTIDALREYGANVEEGLGRCLQDENFYLTLVQMALEDKRLSALEEELAAEEWDKAFEIAHALKGIYGNVALTPLFTPVSALTELLRGKSGGDYASLLEQAKAEYARLAALAE